MAEDEKQTPTTTTTTQPPPPLYRSILPNCDFSHWYPHFKSYCIPSRILPLPQEFVAYLSNDDFVIPAFLKLTLKYTGVEELDSDDEEQERKQGVTTTTATTTTTTDSSSSSSETAANANANAVDPWLEYNHETFFPEVMTRMATAMLELKRNIFVRMNFSSLQDGKWIMPSHLLKCTTVAEILLLIKGSESAQANLTGHLYSMCNGVEPIPSSSSSHIEQKQQQPQPQQQQQLQKKKKVYQPCLVLQKYSNLYPGRQFRCFLQHGELIAACQRDEHHLPEFSDLTQKSRLTQAIDTFFDKVFLNEMGSPEQQQQQVQPDKVFDGVEHLIVDVYVAVEGWKVYLMDVHPFADITDTLLFSWEELLNHNMNRNNDEGNTSFEMRLVPVDEVGEMHRSTRNFNMSDIETPALAANSAEAIESLIRLMQLQNENDDKAMQLAHALQQDS